jgi:hypothetical protein
MIGAAGVVVSNAAAARRVPAGTFSDAPTWIILPTIVLIAFAIGLLAYVIWAAWRDK